MRQKVIFGNEAIVSFEKLVKSINPKSLLIVTGKKSFKKSGANRLFQKTINEHRSYIFDEFSNDPSFEDVLTGLRIMKKIKPDLIVAIGGGSAIDMAKHLNILSANSDIKKKIINNKSLKKSNIPLIAIPTTSGTGSESTSFAVIYLSLIHI